MLLATGWSALVNVLNATQGPSFLVVAGCAVGLVAMCTVLALLA